VPHNTGHHLARLVRCGPSERPSEGRAHARLGRARVVPGQARDTLALAGATAVWAAPAPAAPGRPMRESAGRRWRPLPLLLERSTLALGLCLSRCDSAPRVGALDRAAHRVPLSGVLAGGASRSCRAEPRSPHSCRLIRSGARPSSVALLDGRASQSESTLDNGRGRQVARMAGHTASVGAASLGMSDAPKARRIQRLAAASSRRSLDAARPFRMCAGAGAQRQEAEPGPIGLLAPATTSTRRRTCNSSTTD
jgi:hypothetical protein